MSELYTKLSDAVVAMKTDDVKQLAQKVLDEGLPPDQAIEKGLAAGMNRVGDLFACKEYFVPEVLVCSRAMYAGFDILKDHVVEGTINNKGAIAIGVVAGDFHDIGKNIVKLMLEAAGFRIVDLGKNVSTDKFVETVHVEKPNIVALSTLMTTTMENMQEIAEQVKGIDPDLKVMLGGAPINLDFAESIGAHFYGEDARSAVKGAHQLLGLSLEA